MAPFLRNLTRKPKQTSWKHFFDFLKERISLWCIKKSFPSFYVMAPFLRNLTRKHHVGENPDFWLFYKNQNNKCIYKCNSCVKYHFTLSCRPYFIEPKKYSPKLRFIDKDVYNCKVSMLWACKLTFFLIKISWKGRVLRTSWNSKWGITDVRTTLLPTFFWKPLTHHHLSYTGLSDLLKSLKNYMLAS